MFITLFKNREICIVMGMLVEWQHARRRWERTGLSNVHKFQVIRVGWKGIMLMARKFSKPDWTTMPHQGLILVLFHTILCCGKNKLQYMESCCETKLNEVPTFFNFLHECHFVSCNKVWHRSFLLIFCKIAIKFTEQLLLKFNLLMYYSATDV